MRLEDFRGISFQDAGEIKKAICNSPGDDEIKNLYIKFLEDVFGELKQGDFIDCLDLGIASGDFIDVCSMEEFHRFLKVRGYISDLDNLPVHQGIEVSGEKVNDVIRAEVNGKQIIFPCVKSG